MVFRWIGRMLARANPLMAKQLRAVELQERNKGYRLEFTDQIPAAEFAAARDHPALQEAERLFQEILQHREGLAPGARAVTSFQLGMLYRAQGRLDEAESIFEALIHECRSAAEATAETEWALCRALLRYAERRIRQDRALGRALLEESLEIAVKRKDQDAIRENEWARKHFGLA